MTVDRAAEHERLSFAGAYALARPYYGDGYAFTTYVVKVPATMFAALSVRYCVHPSVLSLANMALAAIASGYVIVRAGHAEPYWLPGLVACVIWQLAYVLDCADGQAARAMGKASEYGARLDVLVDLSVHCMIVSALLSVAARLHQLPVSFIAVCAVLWTVNLFVGVLTRTDGSSDHSFISGGPLEYVKIVRDTGFILLLVGGWLYLDPGRVIYPIVLVSVLNGAFLFASIMKECWLSMRVVQPSPEMQ